MTFRQGGKINSGSVRAGGSGRGRGMAVGGGIGGFAVLLIALFLGVNPNDLQDQLGGGAGGTAIESDAGSENAELQERIDSCTLSEANTDDTCLIVATVESIQQVWSNQYPDQVGRQYQEAGTVIFSGNVSTACGNQSSAVGPFYCPGDNHAYLDPSFFHDVLERQLGGVSTNPAKMYVLAHEYGHHIQTLTGDIQRSQQDRQGRESGAVRVELQADCYAGLWAHYATQTPAPGGEAPLLESLAESDLRDIVRTAEVIGDDHIQRQSGQRVDDRTWSHGSSEMRRDWFVRGYEEGSVQSCNTFDQEI